MPYKPYIRSAYPNELYHSSSNELYHHGIKGQRWGIRRWQNPDGTLTTAGRKRYGIGTSKKAYALREQDRQAREKQGENTTKEALDDIYDEGLHRAVKMGFKGFSRGEGDPPLLASKLALPMTSRGGRPIVAVHFAENFTKSSDPSTYKETVQQELKLASSIKVRPGRYQSSAAKTFADSGAYKMYSDWYDSSGAKEWAGPKYTKETFALMGLRLNTVDINGNKVFVSMVGNDHVNQVMGNHIFVADDMDETFKKIKGNNTVELLG